MRLTKKISILVLVVAIVLTGVTLTLSQVWTSTNVTMYLYESSCEHSPDINGDCYVNYLDLYLLAKAYGSKCGDSNYNEKADLNCDCKVDYNDLYILAKHYGQKVC